MKLKNDIIKKHQPCLNHRLSADQKNPSVCIGKVSGSLVSRTDNADEVCVGEAMAIG